MYNSLIAIVEAELFDSALAQVLGPYGALLLLVTAGAMIAVTAGSLIRGVLDQIQPPTGNPSREEPDTPVDEKSSGAAHATT